MTINARIKQLRKLLGLSQADFAKGISASNSFIAAIELNNRSVNERMVKLICSVFHVSRAWLVNGEGEPFTQSGSYGVDQATQLFMRLTPAHQNFVMEMMTQLLQLQNEQ